MLGKVAPIPPPPPVPQLPPAQAAPALPPAAEGQAAEPSGHGGDVEMDEDIEIAVALDQVLVGAEPEVPPILMAPEPVQAVVAVEETRQEL